MNEKIKKLKEYAAGRPCGTRSKYCSGCRCDECRKANTEYQKERDRLNRRGEHNPLVDAEPAREHLRKLSKAGIGYKTVAEYSGIGKSTLYQLMTGTRTKVRRKNLDAILAVDRSCFTAGTLIRAGETWRRINWMLDEGFTKAEIARRLGHASSSLQFKKKKVTGKTHVKVERLERILRLGE